ncbi:MAG: hypothetical protein G01um101418_651 [Parcubacteria group bacterium Gr01-1014_18]|nr:MAG: hypothetical protein Greene041636_638 [Parcubacteria group bacterium Greene0416_36]TSC80732.1 MAG: hypothetical protein G01um101418_651 [Parcubacteria group bacterium Gr01-1014_18]TSC98657.1 MAG: hypothetical protein Greene101420_616 [Parcubacteria group bacterium Greene1014_20]TSD07183.1 MAG: hypothetical protein Greene07142_352 [Parcubacteria group bacterium Greene0714_2]
MADQLLLGSIADTPSPIPIVQESPQEGYTREMLAVEVAANPALAPYVECFPWHIPRYFRMREAQLKAFRFLSQGHDQVLLEGETGVGKSLIGIVWLSVLRKLHGYKRIFYVVPNLAQAKQIAKRFSDMVFVLEGRESHDCLYYPDQKPAWKANEIPCAILRSCGHRVDQATGKTLEEGAVPCPYYAHKYAAKQYEGIVVTTYAFYLIMRLFKSEKGVWEDHDAVVLDEVHNITPLVRNVLSYDITDWHLERAIEVVEKVDESVSVSLKKFLVVFKKIVSRNKPPFTKIVLEDDEIKKLIKALEAIDTSPLESKKNELEKMASQAEGGREALNEVQNLLFNLWRYIQSLRYAIPKEENDEIKHMALNYVFSYFVSEPIPEEEYGGRGPKVINRLTIQSHHVRPLIRKKVLLSRTLAMSATIGDRTVFGYISGIDFPQYLFLESGFPAENTRIYMPSDTPSLAYSVRSDREPAKSLESIVKECKLFNAEGIRVLVLVGSHQELDKFLFYSSPDKENLDVITYSRGRSSNSPRSDAMLGTMPKTPKEAVELFRGGKGMVLLGTEQNFSEGIDLPDGLAQVVITLRPGYPDPNSPESKFENRKFGKNGAFAIHQWLVKIRIKQARGRTERDGKIKSVTICYDQRFKGLVYYALPEKLRTSYISGKTFADCCLDARAFLKK